MAESLPTRIVQFIQACEDYSVLLSTALTAYKSQLHQLLNRARSEQENLQLEEQFQAIVEQIKQRRAALMGMNVQAACGFHEGDQVVTSTFVPGVVKEVTRATYAKSKRKGPWIVKVRLLDGHIRTFSPGGLTLAANISSSQKAQVQAVEEYAQFYRQTLQQFSELPHWKDQLERTLCDAQCSKALDGSARLLHQTFPQRSEAEWRSVLKDHCLTLGCARHNALLHSIERDLWTPVYMHASAEHRPALVQKVCNKWFFPLIAESYAAIFRLEKNRMDHEE